MINITKTVEAIAYFRLAIKNIQEALSNQIEQDEEYLIFKQKFLEKHGYCFLFFEHSMEFEFYSAKEHNDTYFRINQNSEIIYDENNTFDGIEDVAKEAQKIVSKFYKSEEK